MANRVEFTDKAGNVKNMDKPTAMRLQARKKGKITKEISLGNRNSAKKVVALEESLLEAEIQIEEKDAEIVELKGDAKEVEELSKGLSKEIASKDKEIEKNTKELSDMNDKLKKAEEELKSKADALKKSQSDLLESQKALKVTQNKLDKEVANRQTK